MLVTGFFFAFFRTCSQFDHHFGYPNKPNVSPFELWDVKITARMGRGYQAGLVERYLIDKKKKMYLARIVSIHLLQFGALFLSNGIINQQKKKLMVSGLDTKDKAEVKPLQILDMRCVIADRIFGDYEFKVWVFTPKCFEETADRVPFTIVFNRTVLTGNHFGKESDHLATIRMDQGSCIHLLVIQLHSVATRFLQAVGLCHLG
jgi:hypothetical protein